MQFDPVIHTKTYLLTNPNIAFQLAYKSHNFQSSETQPTFDKSDIANDFEILSLVDDLGNTIAHILASFNPEWVFSEAAKSFDVLQLIDSWGQSVAHVLAEKRTEWLSSEAAKTLSILKLADKQNYTVAHILATNQPDWLLSDAAQSIEILSLTTRSGKSVAYMIATDYAMKHPPLMHKKILTLHRKGKLLAEVISDRHGGVDGFDILSLVTKIISQGAAYKHSKVMPFTTCDILLQQCKTIVSENIDPLISFKQLQALYSTFHWNVKKMIEVDQIDPFSKEMQKTLLKLQDLVSETAEIIRQHLNNNSILYNIEHAVDIFCEPGDDLLKKLKSERVMSTNLASLNAISIEITSDQTTNTQSFY